MTDEQIVDCYVFGHDWYTEYCETCGGRIGMRCLNCNYMVWDDDDGECHCNELDWLEEATGE